MLACESPLNGLHPDGSIASFTWNFGDGQTGTGQKPDHVYTTAGTFTATLTVTENEGASHSLVRANLITVSNPSPGQYTLGIQVTGQGIVAMNPTGGSYAPGTSVTLTATPDSGWELSGWSGDLTGSANPATITMDANKTVTATFTETSNDDPTGSGGSGGGGGGCFIDSAPHGWRLVPHSPWKTESGIGEFWPALCTKYLLRPRIWLSSREVAQGPKAIAADTALRLAKCFGTAGLLRESKLTWADFS